MVTKREAANTLSIVLDIMMKDAASAVDSLADAGIKFDPPEEIKTGDVVWSDTMKELSVGSAVVSTQRPSDVALLIGENGTCVDHYGRKFPIDREKGYYVVQHLADNKKTKTLPF